MKYCSVLVAVFFASCVNMTEGLDEGDVLVIDTDKIEMNSDGGEQTVKVVACCSWKVSSSEDWSWITTSKNKGDKGGSTFKLVLSENFTVEDRTATVTVENRQYEVVHEIAVLQKAGSAFVTLSKDSMEATSEGLTEVIVVESNIDYTISSSEEWCKISKVTGKKGQTEVEVQIDPSAITGERKATVSFVNANHKVSTDLTVVQSPFMPELAISDSKFETTENGGKKQITVTSNIPWTATCESDWVSLSKVNGESGESIIQVTVKENAGVDARNAKILVSNSEYEIVKEISVAQLQFSPSLVVSETKISSTDLGIRKDVVVESNIPWTAACEAEWVTVSKVSGTEGANTITVEVAKNQGTEARTAKVVISNSEYGLVHEIAVSQLPILPSLEVSDTEISTSESGVTKSVSVTSNIRWTAACTADWVTLSSVNGAEGTSVIGVTIQRNLDVHPRETKIVVSNSEYGITREITVSQLEVVPKLTVSESQITATVSGGSKNIRVESNLPWVASCSASWVDLSEISSDGGDKTIVVTTEENTTTSERTATIQLRNADYDITSTITVSQSAFVPELVISNSTLDESAAGGVKNVTVTSNVVWEAACNQSWVTVSPVNETGGTKTLSIAIAANGSTSSRSAVVTVRNRNYNILREITVTQAEFVPEVSPVAGSTAEIDYMAGTKFVAVSANVEYNVSTTSDWLTVEKVTGGINLIYSMNDDGASSRNAEVLFTSDEYSSFSTVLNVTQLGFSENNIIRIESTSGLFFPANGSGFGANVVAVTMNNGACEIRFDGPVTAIPNNAFSGSSQITGVVLPSTVTSVGSYAFSGCTSLASVTLTGNLMSIGSYAFQNCSSLTTITIPDGVSEISSSVFNGCSSLESVVIPSTVTKLGSSVFNGCSSLENVTLPENLTEIGTYAFNGCEALDSIEIPETVSAIGSYAFCNCASLQSMDLPEGVSSIQEHTFDGCSSLESVDLPSSLTTIGASAFYNCKKLDEVVIPTSVTAIGPSAFYNCSSLDKIIIPRSVSSIGSYAFAYCSALKTVISLGATPPTGASSMFSSNASGRKIYVPSGYISDYKTASYWNSYSSYIYALEYTPFECVSLTITASDVRYDETNTIITYSAITNGSTPFGNLENIEVTGSVLSDEFETNMTEEDIERTLSYTYLGVTATTTITHKCLSGRYEVILNSAWRASTIYNPNSSLYDGVYESYSNKGVNSRNAVMYIDIEGYETFTIYVRSYGESNYDYVTVSELDSSNNKVTTYGKSNSSTSISSYTAVTYTNISSGKHRITITYRKDSSQHSGDDRGYLLIPKNQQ